MRLPRSCWAFYDRVDGSTPTAAIADALDLSQEETFAAVHGLQSRGLIEEAVVTYEAYSAPDSDRAPAPKPESADAESADAELAGVDSAGESSTPAGTSSAGTGRAPSGDGSAPASGAPSLYPDDAKSAEASVDNGAGEDATAVKPTGESDEGSAAKEVPAADASPDDPPADDPPADDPPADEGPVSEAFTGEEHLGDASSGERPVESPEAAPGLHLPSFWAWLEEHAPNAKEYKNTQAFILMETSGPLSRIGIDSMDDLQELERCDDPEVVEALEAAVENNLNESIPSSCYQ